MIRFDSLYDRPVRSEESWKPIVGLPEATKLVKIDSTIGKPPIIDLRDAQPNSVLFSLGIAEQCTRHDRILQFLVSGLDDAGGGTDLSMLVEAMVLQGFTINMHQKTIALDCGTSSFGAEAPPTFIYPSSQLYSHTPILQIADDFAHKPEIMFPDGQGSLSGVSPELRDILGIVAGYYLSKNSPKLRKESMIPHFNRLDWIAARADVYESTSTLERVKFAPTMSPLKKKSKPSEKKKSNKKVRERDLHRDNSFHAYESLLSIMINKRQNGKTVVLLLKKSGPELPRLLTQFSASIAGTGLAVLFSVICKVAHGGELLSRSKLLNTSMGFGLFFLSSAVNRLRNTVVGISKGSGKHGLKEDEMVKKLDECANQVFFRTLALMAVLVLRFA